MDSLLKDSLNNQKLMPNTPLIQQTNLHVLIADDDNDDIGFFHDTLQDISKDIKISTVNNGAELMEFLHAIVPDIIFLDINMPCKTGIECLAEIRELHNLSRIPVVIYSTANIPKQIEKTYELGANLYFEKPHSYKGMKDGLTKILSKTSQMLLSEMPMDEYVIRA